MATTSSVKRAMTPDSLALFLQEIIVEFESYKKNVRRSEVRETVSIPVEARRLDEEFNPVGDEFHMVTRDVSCNGVGLFHLESLEPGPIELTLTSPVSDRALRIVANVEHCTAIGKYFMVGCRFLGACVK